MIISLFLIRSFISLKNLRFTSLAHDRDHRRGDGLPVPFRTGLERITLVRSKTVVLVDIKAGATLIRRFKREPYALMYLVHDRDACTEVAFPMLTFDVYRLLKSHDL